MHSIPIYTLEQRAAFIDRFDRHRDSLAYGTGDEPYGPTDLHVGQLVMVGGGRIQSQREAAEITSVAQPASTVEVDLAALAAAFAQRLDEDDAVTVTREQSERYVRSLQLTAPRSRRSLYLTTRAIFVTDIEQVAAFNRVFADVFGAPAGADRYRESQPVRVPAHA